jgi:methyl-accepting chemotaxis protein
MSIQLDKTFEDLVTAVQTIAYGEGEHLNENMRTSQENLAISLYQLQDHTERTATAVERIADAFDQFIEVYSRANLSIYQRHPGIDMTEKVQRAMDKMSK